MKLHIVFAFCFLLSNFNIMAEAESPADNKPILLLATKQEYGLFTGEILKTEGFNEFEVRSFLNDKITTSFLKKFDVVILCEWNLSAIQFDIVRKYVEDGGNLISFLPHPVLADVFGLQIEDGKMQGGYIATDSQHEIARGIISKKLKFHGTADKYSLKGAGAVAYLYADPTSTTRFPAITVNSHVNGRAIAYLYNLPKSVVYTRQGNPEHAGEEKDGILGIRGMDLFTSGWVDTSKNVLNQADEQMRLLSHCVEYLNMNRKPLPRLWYFPDSLKCLVTLHNDGEDSKEAEFNKQFEDVDSKGAKMTLYVKEPHLISNDWIQKWINKGFEISGHPDDTKQAENPDWKTMDSVFANINYKLKDAYGIKPMRTVTNHWFVWCGRDENGDKDFAAQARIEEKHGVLIDCNYAHYDNKSTEVRYLGTPGYNQGNYTGSGLLMRFGGNDGSVINVYQHFNNVYDQFYMEYDDKEGFFNCFKGLMDRSIRDEVYSFVSVKSHNNEYFFSEKPLMRMLDYARSMSIPVWTELKLLDFMNMKDEAAFENISWKNGELKFQLTSSLEHEHGLTFMVPAEYGGNNVQYVTCNGERKPLFNRKVKGREYSFVTLKPGKNYLVRVTYGK